jgi:hypothetical protein
MTYIFQCIPDPENRQGACLTCKKSRTRVTKLPCLRWKLTDIRIFRPGQALGFEWTARWSDSVLEDISIWAHGKPKTIEVTEGLVSVPLPLQVAEFIPLDGDTLERSWVVSGVKKSVRLPPYAIFNLEAAKTSYLDYINSRGAEFVQAAIDMDDSLLWATYDFIFKTANDPNTVSDLSQLIELT